MLGIFLGATFYLYVYLDDFLVGFGVWSAFHCIQYYGIVWVFNQSRVAKNAAAMAPLVRFLFRPSVGLALLYAGLILAYGSLNYLVSFVTDAVWRQVLMAFTFSSTALHYYYDGFIWKIREPETRAYLNIGTEARRGLAAASAVVAGAFQRLQPANNGRLQLGYLSAILLLLVATETWWPHAELSMRQSLVALAPSAGEAHFNLGEALWKQGRPEAATMCCCSPPKAQHNSWRGDLIPAVTNSMQSSFIRAIPGTAVSCFFRARCATRPTATSSR